MQQLMENLLGIQNPQQLVELDPNEYKNLECFHFYWKDKMGKYLGANNQLATAVGYKHINEMITKTDFDLDCLPAIEATNLRNNDQRVMKTEKTLTLIEPVTLVNNQKVLAISQKTPLRSRSKKIIGIIGFSFILDRSFLELTKKNECEIPLYLSEKINTHPFLKSKKTISKRQIQCLYYISKGMTAKQIGKKLNLSPRTIESYLYLLKRKFNCSSRYELFAELTQLGLLKQTWMLN